MADDTDSRSQDPKWKGRLWRLLFAATALLTVMWTVGQITRDRGWVTGMCFYVPSPCLVVLLGLSALGCRRRPRIALACLVLALPPAFFVGCVENRWTRRAPVEGPSLRLVHWNVFRRRRAWDRVLEELRSHQADLYVVSEVYWKHDLDKAAERLGDGFRWVRPRGMAILARGELSDGRWLVKSQLLKVYAVTWEWQGQRLRLFAVDVAANLAYARGPRLKRLADLIAEHRPDLVVGDLNAPRRSRALAPLPEGFRHAYDAAGRGWSYTWPVPCPVYAIDQCILGERIVPHRYELHTSLHSDHRLQLLDFALAGP